jgi:hypothetical protein
MKIISKLSSVKIRLDGRNRAGNVTTYVIRLADTNIDEVKDMIENGAEKFDRERRDHGEKEG